eukprot:SAG31_NODE_793_length_12044_cov_12.886229_1_plen_67_part_00
MSKFSKSRQGLAPLPSWTGPLLGLRKPDCRSGLLPVIDPLDYSSDSDGYYGDDVGNYCDDDLGDDY